MDQISSYVVRRDTPSLHAILSRRWGRVIITPHLGEFGIYCQSHVRLVHAVEAEEKLVCCERGDEFLFPSATGFFCNYVNPVPDQFRVGVFTGAADSKTMMGIYSARSTLLSKISLLHPQYTPLVFAQINPLVSSRFTVPEIKTCVKVPAVDVLIATRSRKMGGHRNYQRWGDVIGFLADRGISTALVGREDTSADDPRFSYRTWEYGKTEAATAALLNCKLFLSTDTGVAHLAALLKVPTMIIPFLHTEGMTACLRECNPNFILLPKVAWRKPRVVADSVEQYLQFGGPQDGRIWTTFFGRPNSNALSAGANTRPGSHPSVLW